MSDYEDMGVEFHDFEREVLDRLIKIEAKLDSVDSAKATTYENQREIIALKKDTAEQEHRIKSLEDSNKWIWRTVAGSIIATLIAILSDFISI